MAWNRPVNSSQSVTLRSITWATLTDGGGGACPAAPGFAHPPISAVHVPPARSAHRRILGTVISLVVVGAAQQTHCLHRTAPMINRAVRRLEALDRSRAIGGIPSSRP